MKRARPRGLQGWLTGFLQTGLVLSEDAATSAHRHRARWCVTLPRGSLHTVTQGRRPATAHGISTKVYWGPVKCAGDRKGVCLWGLAVARWVPPAAQGRPVGPRRSPWLRGGHFHFTEPPQGLPSGQVWHMWQELSRGVPECQSSVCGSAPLGRTPAL